MRPPVHRLILAKNRFTAAAEKIMAWLYPGDREFALFGPISQLPGLVLASGFLV